MLPNTHPLRDNTSLPWRYSHGHSTVAGGAIHAAPHWTHYSAVHPVWSYVPLAPRWSLRHVHVVRSIDWSQRPMHRHAGRPLPLNMCGRLLPLLTIATLKPLCLISIENFPAEGKPKLLFIPHMMYTYLHSSFRFKHFTYPFAFKLFRQMFFLINKQSHT